MKLSLKAWQLAWPIILSNICVPLLGMIDLAVVGQIEDKSYLPVVAIGSVFFDTLLGLFVFLRMSTTGLSAQNPKEPAVLFRGLMIALLLSLLLFILKPYIWHLCFYLANNNFTIQPGLFLYFSWRFYAIPAILCQSVLIGYCFGRKNTKIPLFVLTISNTIAIVLDVFLVLYLNWGLKGLALANIIAQMIGLLISLTLIQLHYELFKSIFPLHWVKLKPLLKTLQINQDIFIRTLGLMFTLAYFTHVGSTFGIEVVAANAILGSMVVFTSYALDGFAIACEAMIGHAIFTKNKMAFFQAIYECGIWSLLVALLFCFIWWCFGGWVIDVISNVNRINIIALKFLPWLYILPLVAVSSYLLDGVYIGATWAKEMRNSMIASVIFVFFPAVILLKPLGNHGLWLSFSLFLMARASFLSINLKNKIKNDAFLQN